MTQVAIMQPTFLPWLGYFALIDRVDRFLYLDDVQLSRQSWQTRNRLKGPQGPVMLSLPVARKPSLPMIQEARLADTGFERAMMITARHLLGRAPFAPLALSILEQGLNTAGGNLATLTITMIEAICTATAITTPRNRTSHMTVPSGDKIARLVALCRAAGAAAYLSPMGAADYLEGDTAFAAAGIDLGFFNFEHPVYPQSFPPFLGHMSALDALAHVGPDAFLPLIRSGIRPDLPAVKGAE